MDRRSVRQPAQLDSLATRRATPANTPTGPPMTSRLNLARLLLAAILPLAPLPLSAAAQDQVTVNQQTIYYDVARTTIEELADSISRNAPRRLGGFDAKTDFSFAWNADRMLERDASGATSCRQRNASVVIDIALTLPRFSAVADASGDVRRAWKAYITALERHEANHAKDFIETGSQIPSALEAIVATNCTAALRAANAKGKEFVALAQQQAADYDLWTNHGVKEGAVLPGF